EQILGLSPATQTVTPGTAAPYTVTVRNPTSQAVTYNLAVTGVAPAWVTISNNMTVPAGGQVAVPLTLRSDLSAVAGTYSFTVTAGAPGVSGSVQGSLVLQGSGNAGAVTNAAALAVTVSLVPPSATGGQGTPATYAVQVTNVGNVADGYFLSILAPPG